MLKIKINARVSCKKHPLYDPAKQGEGGIVGGCGTCQNLLRVYQRAIALEFDFSEKIGLHVNPTGHYLPDSEALSGSARFRYQDR